MHPPVAACIPTAAEKNQVRRQMESGERVASQTPVMTRETSPVVGGAATDAPFAVPPVHKTARLT